MTQPPPFNPDPNPPKPVYKDWRAAIKYLDLVHNWNISISTLYNWARTGRKGVKLKHIVRNGKMFFSEQDLDDFIAAYH